MSRNPWFKFYPTDWQSDLALRACSANARALWIELLCIMHQAEPRGYLLVGGEQPSTQELSVFCALPEKIVKEGLNELKKRKVLSELDDETLFSRRMVRDEEKSKRDKANGKKGGNPTLKPGVNPIDIPPFIHGVKG